MKLLTTSYQLRTKRAFTLMELLVVIGIIGILVTLGAVSLINVQKRARDSRRLSDMKEIVVALEAYKQDKGTYPLNADSDCSGWDMGYNGGKASGDPFIQVLVTEGYLKKPVGDPVSSGACPPRTDFNYYYYRYSPGAFGCDANQGYFYVLAVRNMETLPGSTNHPQSPGWVCSGSGGGHWGQQSFDWVTGSYE